MRQVHKTAGNAAGITKKLVARYGAAVKTLPRWKRCRHSLKGGGGRFKKLVFKFFVSLPTKRSYLSNYYPAFEQIHIELTYSQETLSSF